jgi:hypothetical protein
MLQWNTEAVRTGGDYDQPADFYSFMFPYSTDVADPHPDPPNNGRAPDAGQYHSHSLSHQVQHEASINSLPQRPRYETSINNVSYQTYLTQPGFSSPTSVHQTQSYHAPAAQEEYFSLPQRTYTTSSNSPSIPTSPPPSAISPNEPQIRLNPNMFKPDYGRFMAVPLDSRHVGR